MCFWQPSSYSDMNRDLCIFVWKCCDKVSVFAEKTQNNTVHFSSSAIFTNLWISKANSKCFSKLFADPVSLLSTFAWLAKKKSWKRRTRFSCIPDRPCFIRPCTCSPIVGKFSDPVVTDEKPIISGFCSCQNNAEQFGSDFRLSLSPLLTALGNSRESAVRGYGG